MLVYCKDCEYCHRTADGLILVDTPCMVSTYENYVTGEKHHYFCSNVNTNGHCPKYKAKENKNV